jgi:hypothetical protein
MSQMKHAAKGKRSKKALSALGVAGLGVAGLSLLPVNGSVAAMLSPGAAVTPLAEEEISDVTLATFHVYDKENAGVARSPLLQLAGGCGHHGGGCGRRGGCGRCGRCGCRGGCGCGCGGCGCGYGWCLSWGGCRPWC